MKTENELEFLFLSTCYGKGISDDLVYSLYVKKIVGSLPVNKSYSMSQLTTEIKLKYGIEIPPTFVSKICRTLSDKNTELVFKKDQLTIKSIPKEIESEIVEIQRSNDKDSRLVFESFNNHLKFNSQNEITYKEYISLIKAHCDILIGKKVEELELRKIFSVWISSIYTSKAITESVIALNKILFSYLIYSYFYSVKRTNKKLQSIKVYFDTNLIIYMLGINGDERQNYVNYLIEKLKETRSTIVITAFTIEELKRLLLNSPSDHIRVYNLSKKYERDQIFMNSEEFFLAYFQSKSVQFYFEKKLSANISDANRNDQEVSLRQYKSHFRFISDFSISHDINLINILGPIKNVSNMYKETSFIVSTDLLLCNWYSKFLKDEKSRDETNLLTLEKLNMILWIENDKAINSNFLGNTWMFITESLPFFKNTNVDSLFKKFKEIISGGITVPENWRSPYLLIKSNFDSEKNIFEIEEDDFECILDKINLEGIGAFPKMKH